MARGGKRAGAGRKASDLPKKTRTERNAVAAIAIEAAMGELTRDQIAAMSPLEMIEYAALLAALGGKWGIAADLAAKVAPYRHAKLAPVSPVPPQEDLDTKALALHRRLLEMDATVGSDTALGATEAT